MDKRTFLKSLIFGAAAAPLTPTAVLDSPQHRMTKSGRSFWVWARPRPGEDERDLDQRYRAWHRAGITGVLFETFSERHYRIAKAEGLQAHRWMWTLNRGDAELLRNHRDWYSVSRSGKSCATDPPYVNHYRFLCPSPPDVLRFLQNEAQQLLENPLVDGLHLDFIRYVDVILPVNLWDKYGLEQQRELPDYDFCYSTYSKAKFKKETGIDIDRVKYPDQSHSWRTFRYREITHLVNQLAEIAASYQKPMSAAVFPTPEVARRLVRQDWPSWNLDAVFPMIYHRFYREPVSWIGDAVQEGVDQLRGRFPLYAGLFLPDFDRPETLKEAIALAFGRGAAGVSLFGNVDDRILKTVMSV